MLVVCHVGSKLLIYLLLCDCRKLRDRDVTSKSDPMCILYMSEFGSTKFKEVR